MNQKAQKRKKSVIGKMNGKNDLKAGKMPQKPIVPKAQGKPAEPPKKQQHLAKQQNQIPGNTKLSKDPQMPIKKKKKKKPAVDITERKITINANRTILAVSSTVIPTAVLKVHKPLPGEPDWETALKESEEEKQLLEQMNQMESEEENGGDGNEDKAADDMDIDIMEGFEGL